MGASSTVVFRDTLSPHFATSVDLANFSPSALPADDK